MTVGSTEIVSTVWIVMIGTKLAEGMTVGLVVVLELEDFSVVSSEVVGVVGCGVFLSGVGAGKLVGSGSVEEGFGEG